MSRGILAPRNLGQLWLKADASWFNVELGGGGDGWS